MARLSIDQYMMGIAAVVKARSDWPGTRVGCVVAVDGMVRSTGYNGTPKGWKPNQPFPQRPMDIAEGLRALKPLFCHAEENAIVQAARAGIALQGATFYTTMSPCLACARMMVNVGAVRVVFLTLWEGEESTEALGLIKSSGVCISKLEP